MGFIVAGAAIGAGASIIGGIFGASSAKKRARAAAREKARLAKKLDSLEKSRQAVINPYASSISNQSDIIQDMGGELTNSYNNLGVATQGARMQAEEADIALANTLDTLQASGASAGGATALAQAALQSKKGVAASIETQEAQNEKLRAQGEQTLQRQKMAEAQRIQGAEVSGKSFVFNQTEQRQVAELDRVSSQLTNQQNLEAQASSDITSAITGTLGGAITTFGA